MVLKTSFLQLISTDKTKVQCFTVLERSQACSESSGKDNKNSICVVLEAKIGNGNDVLSPAFDVQERCCPPNRSKSICIQQESNI